MIFSSISFLFLLLPIMFGVYILIPNIKLKNLFLTLGSLFFYAWGEPVYVFLMLFSVFINWGFGMLIHKFDSKKNLLLGLAVVANIGLLFYFKYCAFVVELLNLIPHVNLAVPVISLPIGISFFTFQALSYVFDVKRGEVKVQKNIMNLLLYVSLFPQLIAGPIVKYHDVEQQIQHRNCSADKIAKGIRRFLIGLTKKMIIANNMAFIVDTLFAIEPSELNIFAAWLGAVAYMFQIYFDFSGYSDMAIGLGRIFGFEFKENFNYPFIATGIKDFWRRWHISLSTWFKEYLYIPLGGNRKGKTRTYVNQFIVFFATGLWHGANLTFVVWGLMHGLFLVLESCGIINVEKMKYKWVQRLYTLFVATILFVVFRADNMQYALSYLKQMFLGFDFISGKSIVALQLLTPYMILVFVIAIFASWDIIPRIRRKLDEEKTFMGIHVNVWEPLTYIVTLLFFALNILELASSAYNPFIYFRF